MPVTSTWIHGNAFVPQDPAAGVLHQVDGRPYTDVIGAHYGWGVTFEGESRGTWFHVAVPTPAVIDDRPLFLDSFYISFESTPAGAGLREVHAWNGNGRFFNLRQGSSTVWMSGDWAEIQTRGPAGVTDRHVFSNTWSPRKDGKRLRVHRGLGLSCSVSFSRRSRITFFGAGANWSTDEQ